jgi:hypothetical protein
VCECVRYFVKKNVLIEKKRQGEQRGRCEKMGVVRHEQTKVPNEGVADSVKPESVVGWGTQVYIIDIDLEKSMKRKEKNWLSREGCIWFDVL